MKLSVGNLPQSLTDEDLKKLFASVGSVESASIKRGKKTGTSLGYGTVEMADDHAKLAIEKLNGHEIEGKKIVVVDAASLQQDSKNKGSQKAGQGSGGSIHGSKVSGGFSGGTVRRSGGGGRGK